MEMGILLAIIPLLIVLFVVLYSIYELVLRQQWWFYHVSTFMRDIRDKLAPWDK